MKRKRPSSQIDPVRYSFWMFGEDGSELTLHASNLPEARKHTTSYRRYLASLNHHGIAGYAVIVEWRDPESKPVGAIVEKTRKETNRALDKKLEHGMKYYYALTKDGDRLVGGKSTAAYPPKAPPKKKKSAPRPASVSAVLDRVRAKKIGKACDPSFSATIRDIRVSDAMMAYTRQSDLEAALRRFARCDWGDIGITQTRTNNAATRARHRNVAIRGSYWSRPSPGHLSPNGSQFWLILMPSGDLFAVMNHEREEF